ncbi:hypothetical protein [Sphingomonas mollis]|uniref:Glycosyltransferase RgtA/B/C/D-like domain-containing protein n=1 Tax=Sphingomonas mollis TaxID=2795726 RepID=A0ABS0XL54_9SPHN|nr:hypothetical protein [Sphingomonas sp. BT553]MBJ6120760.1 hypothetical protein [Sphingomonas sp. BT553]
MAAPFPLLIDLPAHVARYHVERNLPFTPELSRFFTYSWRYLPNLGVDLSVAFLSQWMNVETAARLVAATIPPIGAAGMLWLGYRLHGRITATTLLSLPLNYAYPLIFGFVNSCLAVSLSFVVCAGWLTLEQRGRTRWSAVLLAVAAPVIITAHMIGYGVMGLMIAGVAAGQAIRRGHPALEVLKTVALKALPLSWPLILLLFWRNDQTGTAGRWFDFALDARWLLMILRERHNAFDIASAGLLYGAALLPLLVRHRFASDLRALVPAILLWICVFLMPSQIVGSEFAAVRLIAPALALSLLAVRESKPLPRWVWGAAFAFVLLRLIVSTVTFVDVSQKADRELALLDRVRSGSRVVAIWLTDCRRDWEPPRYSHLGAFATVRRNALVNGHFMSSGQQLMALVPNADDALTAAPSMISAEPCERLGQKDSAADIVRRLPWRHIDYLWLIDIGDLPLPLPIAARQIATTGQSRLLRVDPDVSIKPQE